MTDEISQILEKRQHSQRMHNHDVLGRELKLFFSRPTTEELILGNILSAYVGTFSCLCSNVWTQSWRFHLLSGYRDWNWNARHLGPDKMPVGEGLTPTHLGPCSHVKTGACINSSHSSQAQRR